MIPNSVTPADTKSAATAREVGRGAIWITVAKLWFILTGTGLLLVLPRIGAETEEARAALFGTYSVVVGIINPITMMLITGTLQATSKFVSENPARYPALLRRILKLQFLFGAGLAALFFLAAPLISELLNDSAMTNPLRLASFIIFIYALYPALIGGFNGLKRFHLQALMDIAFATLKIGLIIAFVYAGMGVLGAIGGFALTAWLLTALAAAVSLSILRGCPEGPDDVGVRQILRFSVWIMAFALTSNLLLNADLYIVKAFSTDDAAVGIYSACLQVARLPYVAVISITFVLFPLVSHATYHEDRATARTYIATATRYSLLIVGVLAICLAALSRDVLALVFPAIYVNGQFQLLFLALAYLAFSLLAIFTTIITSSGSPRTSMLLVAATLALSAILATSGMRAIGPDAAAAGVMLAMFTGTFLALYVIHRRFSPVWPVATLLRLLLSGAVLTAISLLWQPDAKLFIILKSVAMTGAFLLALFLLREFSAEDLARVKNVLSRRKANR